ncbi:MAG: hypothetical protein MI924_11730 [Chloroflexales bacterium]|nr:hypothetical protein [Chloroflexales bacterium]
MHSRIVLVLLVLLVLSGCGFLGDAQPNNTTVPSESTSVERTPSPGIDPVAPSAPQPVASQGVQRFSIEQSVNSDDDVLSIVALIVRSAELTDETLALRVAFQNTGDEGFQLLGGLSGRNAVLVDAAGNAYEPQDVSDNLRASIAPSGGFAPGASNVGVLTFPRPSGGEPYELHFPRYDPVIFRLDTPLVETVLDLAAGDYPVAQSLHSNQSALAPIELHVRTLQIDPEQLSFEVAFVNTGRQGHSLLSGPNGSDAHLLDAEGSQYEPAMVSDSLASSIAPEPGWAPGEAYMGVITFPRPTALEELRFLFPTYDALTIQFNSNGIAAATVTSPSGGAPQPTATPQPEAVAFAALDQLLAAQAQALLAGDRDAYLAGFDPALHAEQEQILDRASRMPLERYSIEIAPDAAISASDAEQGAVEGITVQVEYTLRGINPANVFIHDLRYDFVRNGAAWRISAVETDENPPFWHPGDLVLRETPHFLIVARPDVATELAALEQETETAYAELQTKGLPLEARYVAYFTNDPDDFRILTGQSSSRALGVALSRYTFEDNTIVATGYAFYLNGEAFLEEQRGADARQTTITHELVHLALASDTRPFTPLWVSEGAAVYYSESPGADQRQLLADNGNLADMSLARLTMADSLGEHDLLGQQTGAEYLFSGLTFAYLVETFGEARVLEFYRSYTSVPAADVQERMPDFGGALVTNNVFASLREELTAQSIPAFFGVDLDQLDADVKVWIGQ